MFSFIGPEKYDFHRYKLLLWRKMALIHQTLKTKILIARFYDRSRRVAKYKKIINFLKTLISVL
jgi:hypothetical protein